MSDGRKIIIVRKKVAAHAAHHGGSWKVAYADFVTAMMAFFMVMWIMSMDAGVKDMVQGYFQNPVGFKRSFSGGRNILSQGNSITNLEVRRTVILKRRREEEARLQAAASAIRAEINESGLMEGLSAAVEVVVTDDGLRVEMMETGRGETFFDKSSASLKPALREVLGVVAGKLARLQNGVIVEGHTDALPFGGEGYTNWELSVDRANAARRVMIAGGMPGDQLVEVRGYADKQLKLPDNPLDDRNRRISLLVPFDTPDLTSVEEQVARLIERFDYQRPGDRP
jgi:chemotaxis protein MotB